LVLDFPAVCIEKPASPSLSTTTIRQYMQPSFCLYRVADPSCHPQISLCARIQKKTESWTGHPLKWLCPGLATPKKWQSPWIWWV
jgi:hypothetical protein